MCEVTVCNVILILRKKCQKSNKHFIYITRFKLKKSKVGKIEHTYVKIEWNLFVYWDCRLYLTFRIFFSLNLRLPLSRPKGNDCNLCLLKCKDVWKVHDYTYFFTDIWSILLILLMDMLLLVISSFLFSIQVKCSE